MALNIPVNLMNTAAPPIQPSGPTNSASYSISINAAQPASASANARSAASDGAGMNNSSTEQQALMFKQRMTQDPVPLPDNAEPKSVAVAQTGAPNCAAPQSVEKVEQPMREVRPQSELDRFAPPNPLPTAPILQLAAPYAALTVKPD